MRYEVAWKEVNKKDQFVVKRKAFTTEKAMMRFAGKLTEKDNFIEIMAYQTNLYLL